MNELHDRYARTVDRVPEHPRADLGLALVLDLTPRERAYLQERLDGPSVEYMELVIALDVDGCRFPRVQAALMMLNTPGVAKKVLEDARRAGLL